MPDLFRTFQAEELDDKGRFTGYASVFDVVDSYGTVFKRGAFKKTISDHRGRFPLVWMHDRMSPIGSALVEEDAKGLRVVDGQLDLDVQRGRETYSGMKKGYIADMSHRFNPIRQTPGNMRDGIQTVFDEVRLFEISPATMNCGATDGAVVETVRTDESESEPAPKRRKQIVVPKGLFSEVERLSARLSTPEGAAAPRTRTPVDSHLRTLSDGIQRLEKVLKGTP